MKRFLPIAMFTTLPKRSCAILFFVLLSLFSTSIAKAQSFRTPTFSGALADFNAAERFVSVDPNVTYAITFDATYMYFGAFRTSGTFGGTDNFTIYLDTDPRNTLNSGNGTTAGRNFNNVTPVLPFNADYTSITEQSYTDPLNKYTAAWASTGVTPTVFTNTTCREVRIALSDIGNPASVYATFWMGYNGGLFANAPGTAVTASATPTITGYFGSFPVYKVGVTPVTFRAQNTSAANGGGTAISDLSITTTGNITAGDYGNITVSGAAAVVGTLLGSTSYTGTLTVGATSFAHRLNLGTFTMFAGGRGVGGTAGQVTIGGTSGNPVYSASAGGFSFLGAGLVNGTGTRMFGNTSAVVNMAIGGIVDFTGGSGTTTLFNGGSLQINAGGAMSNPLTFQAGYSLIYNTGGTYTANNEWTTNATTLIPTTVTLQNNTALNFGSSAAYRQANGLVTIGSGSGLTLSSASGGDLRIAAGLTNNNTGAGVGINTNGRAVQSMGTGTYTKVGTDNLDYLIIGSANTLTLASGTNLNLTNTNVLGALQYSAAGTLAMAGTNNVTLSAGTTVGGTTAGTITGTSPTTSLLTLAGTTAWNPGGIVSTNINVGVVVNSGLTITTAGRLSAGYLQINQGGFIGGTNPVVYPTSGTLVYNHTSGTYGVQALEFPAASGPTNLTVNAIGGTGISFATNNITARTLAGTLTINHDVDLSGSGPAALTALNVVANATALVKGSGNFTLSAAGSFTTANVGGINGTLTTSGTKTLPASGASVTFNNATASQVTGTLLPASVAAFTINNPTAATGTTISNNTLIITGTTTLTAGALVLPTAGGNLVTFTGNISTPTSGGTITGSTTSNIVTAGTTAGTAATLSFTSGSATLRDWTHQTTTFGSSATTGLASVVTINGTFTLSASGVPDFWTTSTGGLIIANGATYTDNGATADLIRGAGIFTIQSGGTFITSHGSGLTASGLTGAIQVSGTRTFSGAGNYTFTGTSAQGIGTALDVTGGAGQTGIITGNVILNNSASSGVTLVNGVTITINSPGSLTIGSATAAGTVTALATSVINGSGNVTMLGNGATTGSTLITAHANGVNGTFAGTGTFSLTNGANNNTNFTFNASAAQVTGALMPAIINNLNFSNTFSGSVASPSVSLSSSVTANGTTTFAGGSAPLGLIGIGANTLTLNGIITTTNANKLVGISTSNLIIGGTGTVGASGFFATGGGGVLNNFTLNRTGVTVLAGTTLTVGGTFSTTAGVLSLGGGLTLNGAIAFGAGTITGGNNPLTIGGSGAITGNITATSTPLALTSITMNRSAATLPLGSNVTVSNATGLTLTAGNISLGTFNLTSTIATGQLGAGSTSSMIVATSTGQAFITVPITGFIPQTIPIGDGTNYTPVVLTFTANATGGTVGVKTVASVHPNLNTGSTPVAYISRYWTFTNTLGATYTYSGTYRYISPGDVTGTESNLKLSRWSGSAWAEYSGSSVASPVLSSGSLTQATGPLTFDYTGRVNSTAINYVWSGTTNDWNTAGNWTPSGVPTGIDNVAIDGSLSAVLCSINSSAYSVNNFTLNGTGTFAMASTTSLTVNGNLTYGGSATASFDCASTLNIASSSAQTIPALNFGNLNLTGGNRTLASSGTIGICGTYTPGAGTITTTGSTINFNGTGSQTIPATNYNNLTSSSSGARTLANAGTITVVGTFTPGTNTFTVTGSTVALTATSGTIAVTLPTVGSGNSFNILTINGTGGTFALPYSATTQNLATTLNVTAGTFVLNPASNTTALVNTVAVGTININGGTLDDKSTGGTGLTTTLQVSTAWNHTSGVATNTGTGIDKIQFTGGGATTFAGLTAPASFIFYVVQVSNNTTTTLSNALTVNNVAGNNLTIDLGSTLNASTFVVNTSATGNTMLINGTFKTANTIGFSGAATAAISNTFTPTITLGAASTVEYTSGGTNPLITARADYANLTVSGASTTFSFGGSSVVGVDYNQSAGTVTLVPAAIATAYTLGVTGNFGMTGGTFNVLGSTALGGVGTVTVTGNTTTSGSSSINLESVNNANTTGIGIFQTTNFTTTSTSTSIVNFGATTVTNNEFRVSGNFNKSGTGTFNTSSSTTSNGFIFNKSGTQTFSYAGTNSQYTQYVVNTGSTLQMLTGLTMGSGTVPLSKFTVNGTLDVSTFVISGTTNPTFTLASGATLITANSGGVSTSITTPGTNVYNAGANYEFNGTVAQIANFPVILTTMNNLTVNNSFDVKMNQSAIVNGNIVFTAGNLDLNGSFNITLGTAGNIVSETNTARLINTGAPTATNGFIGTTRTLGVNPGNIANIGLDMSVATAMGSTVIKRFPKVVSAIPTALNSISRVYSILPATASTPSTIALSYFDGELNSNTETAPSLVTFNSTGANETVAANYSYVGATATNPTTNTVTYNAANLSTTNTFWTCLNSVKYITNADGNWHTGATWIGGVVPPANADVIINHIVTVGADSATVNSLIINATKSLTVFSGFDLNVRDAVLNNGTLTLQNNANLIQINNVANSGTGSTVVARNSSALKRFDYTLWSSPVAGQGLYAFSPFTFGNRFYVYRPNTNLYNNPDVGFSITGLNPDGVNGTDSNNVQFASAKGYLIRMPWNHPTAATIWNGSFSGTIPNNGDIPFTMISGASGFRFNLVGNPYPSPMSMSQFVSDNSANITGTLYFWRETNATTANNAYCSWAGGTFTTNSEAQVFNPNGIIRTGQGFIVEGTGAGTALAFKNGQRSSDNTNQFFRTTTDVETNRFWLNLTNTVGAFSQMAAGYMTDATNGVDLYDGKNINDGNVLLNSILDNTDYTIQGKALPFNAADVIPLSCKITDAGEYTITIDHLDGLFLGGTQPIVIKDNLTSTYHDLQTGAYTFTSDAGAFNTRFEILFQMPLHVDNPTFNANQVVIYKNDVNDFVINSGNVMMASVKIFDIRGRLLVESKRINASQTIMNVASTNEVLLVQITSVDGVVVTKKVVR